MFYTNKQNYIYPSTGLDRPVGLRGVEADRIYRQSAHAGDKVVNAHIGRRYSFLLEVELNPGP
jgi:hypothetical protein